MTILSNPITREELAEIAASSFGDMVKGVVDVGRGLVAIDSELHADLESLLLENGSHQVDLWGINLYPDIYDDDFIEYDSLINIRPMQGNRSRGVEDEKLRNKIVEVVNQWIK